MSHPWGWAEWLAWAGVVVPLASLAWAAVTFVLAKKAEIKRQRFEQFFRVMDMIGARGSIASKMGAVFELRKYPEYKEIIIRLCEKADIEGESAEMLRLEFQLLADYMQKV